MKYLLVLFTFAIGLWSLDSMAVDLAMKFNLNKVGQTNDTEKSVTWNPNTQEAIVRMGLVPSFIDPSLSDKSVDFSTAHTVQVVPMDMPELAETCNQVTQWQFEYRPGLPNYLMYITLKGPDCQHLAEYLELYNTRFRFVQVSTQTDAVDVAVQISQ